MFFFLWFLSSLRVKSSITKIIQNNIIEGMTYWFYVFLVKTKL